MKIKGLLQLDALFFLVLGSAVGVLLVIQAQTNSANPNPVGFMSRASEPTPFVTPTVAFVPTVTTASQISSDGTRKVVMNITEQRDASHTYAISTAEDGTVIYRKTLGQNEELRIPFNTWSANNQYFFLEERTVQGTAIKVFQADGEPFPNGEVAIPVTDIFTEKAPNSIFAEATGWAENNLLIINTKREDGSEGSSYWFAVPSRNLIKLSTQF